MVDQNNMGIAEAANEIIRQGRERQGARQFDETCDNVVNACGGDAQGLVMLLAQHDDPDELVVHLASNEDRLEKFKKQQAIGKLAELSSIQSQVSPYGRFNRGHTPAWVGRAGEDNSGDWRNAPNTEAGEREFQKGFERQMAKRAKERGRR